jgi:hypothetical protein
MIGVKKKVRKYGRGREIKENMIGYDKTEINGFSNTFGVGEPYQKQRANDIKKRNELTYELCKLKQEYALI